MKKLEIAKHAIGGLMMLNCIVALINALVKPDVFVIFCAYFSIAPVVAHAQLIHPHWLMVETQGKMWNHLRIMTLWPIAIVECRIVKKRIARLKYLIARIEFLPQEERSTAPEMDEIAKLSKQLASFADKNTELYRKMDL